MLFFRGLLLIVFFSSIHCWAQYDTLHYLPPVFVSDALKTSNSGCRNHYLLLSTNEPSTFSVTIKRGDGALFSDYSIIDGSQSSTGVFNLSRSTPIKLHFNNTGYNVENIFSRNSLNVALDTGGYTLEAPEPFFANIRHLANSQGGSLTCKGTTALGTNFFAGFQAAGSGSNNSVDKQHCHFISIMATLNNTNVTIDGFKSGVTFYGQPNSGSPATAQTITFSLNAGQSYIIAQTRDSMTVDMNEYNGIRISADKSVAVNTGTWTGPSNTGSSRDVGIDQLIPSSFAGEKYALIKGNNTSSSNGLEKVIVISTQAGTTNLTFGSGAAMTLTGAGDYAVVSTNTYWKAATAVATGSSAHHNVAITSDQPVLVFQTLFGSTSGATSSMNLIPPLADCIGSDSIYIPDAEQFGSASSLTITSPTTSTIVVKDESNNLLLTIPPSTENLPGTIITDYRTTSYSIPNSVTDIFVTGDEKFTLGFLGASGVIGGAGYLSAFSDRSVEYATSDPLFIGNGTARLDLCEGNPAYISILDSANYDSFQWYKDAVLIPGENDDSIAVSSAGLYNAIATYCSLPLESTNVFVDEFGSPGEQGFSQISILYESETFDGFANGANISDWDEQSKDFNTMSLVTNGPSVSNTRYNLPGFHPVPYFDASNSEYLKSFNPISNLNGSNEYSFFLVLKDSNATSGYPVLNFENSTTGPKVIKTATGYRFSQEILSTGGPITADVVTSTDEFILLSCVSNGTTVELYANGKKGLVDFGNTTSNTLDIGGHLIMGGNNEASGQFFNGFVAEFMLIDSTLTPTERQIVETYYGVKYGITFDVTNDEAGINDGDYVSNNGTIVWDYSANTDYHNSISGIGLDECGRLRQWQNETNLNDDFVAIGIGEISATVGANPNSFTADNTYFLWGRNTSAFDSNGETDFGTTTNGVLIENRVARIWKTQESGSVGSLRVQFNLGTGAGITYDLADTRLLVDTDDTFMTGALAISPTSYNNATGIVNFDHDFVPGSGFFFSLGTVDAITTPLPITLTNFEVEEINGKVKSFWESASELNNAYYTIEKSIDGENWIFVGTVIGAGNSSVKQTYDLIDSNPFIGLSYYRLSQSDFDGQINYLGIKSVFVEESNELSINVYPNPTQSYITIQTSVKVSGQLRITNSSGQLVLLKNIDQKNQTLVDLSSLSKGIYFIEIIYADKSVKGKIVRN